VRNVRDPTYVRCEYRERFDVLQGHNSNVPHPTSKILVLAVAEGAGVRKPRTRRSVYFPRKCVGK
jgi:hypothetical protein